MPLIKDLTAFSLQPMEQIALTHQLMKEKGILPRRLKMAAICSVCSEAFVKHIQTFTRELSELKEQETNDDNS